MNPAHAFVRANRPNFMSASATVDLSTVNSIQGRHPKRRGQHAATMRRALPAVLLLALCLPAAAAATGSVSPSGATEYQARHVCAPPAPGHATCLSLELVPRTGSTPLPARAPLAQPLSMPPATRVAPLAESTAPPPGTGTGRAKPLASPAGTPAGPDYAAGATPTPLFPKELLSAYDLPAQAPPGSPAQTIALVDAYNDPNAEADLNVYDSDLENDLSACNQKNGCFRKVDQSGGSAEEGASGTPFPRSAKELREREATCSKTKQRAACAEVEEAVGWTVEISTDIDVVHSICQGCHILLVEADTPAFEDLEAAEDTAVRLGATEVSNSWGGSEPTGDSPAFNHPKTVITAAAGDDGYLNWTEAEAAEAGYFVGADYPASSPHVVAVGGTELTLTESGARQSESVWNEDPDPEGANEGAGGGGCSEFFAAPEWQQQVPDWESVGCGAGTEAKRAVADVAADADPYSGVLVYDSLASKEYLIVIGGTSVASPIIASTFALAGGAHEVEYPAQTLYSHLGDPSLYDVTEGGNGECDDLYTGACSGSMDPLSPLDCGAGALICNAASGYDGPTGVGTPNGIAAFAPGSEAEQLAKAEEAKREAERRQAEEAKQAEAELKAREKRAAEEAAEATQRAEAARRAEEARKAEEALKAVEKTGGETAGASSNGSSSQSAGVDGTGDLGSLTEAQLGGGSSSHAGSGRAAIRLTHLALTAHASAALSRGLPALFHVAFAFTLSAPARVRVTLSRQVRVRGHLRWVRVGHALTLTAAGGRHHAHLRGRRALAPGHYRLTAAPARGAARTLAFAVG